MHDFTPDPLNELLGPTPPDPARLEAVRAGTFARTVRALRRGRLVRRLGRVGALAACYAAGLLTAWGLSSGPEEPPPPEPSPPRELGAGPGALALEARAREEERSELYRRAGDHYLAEADPEGALRCYARALDAGTEEERSISPEDSWLLMAIKHARQREMDNVPRVD
jgi:hypothetical protein